MSKDFTPTQAKAWVSREFHGTLRKGRKGVLDRLRHEEQAIKIAREYGVVDQFPNTMAAHHTLSDRLATMLWAL
jgi:hypothetical protein